MLLEQSARPLLDLPPRGLSGSERTGGLPLADGSTEQGGFALYVERELLSLPPLPGTVRQSDPRPVDPEELADQLAPARPGTAPRRVLGEEETAKIQDTAQQLESLLLYQLFKQMWASIPESDLLPAGNAGKIYREMWLEKIAEESSGAGGIGIARLVEQQLTAQAEHTFTPQQAAQLHARVQLPPSNAGF